MRRVSIAPMMQYTDCHFRQLMRLITQKTYLYTEMVVADALVHSHHQRRLLQLQPEEHPVALQVGGSNPAILAESASMAEVYGYNEINLNLGCPSTRVQSGRFGACLMKEPELVADILMAMQNRTSIPVTVKMRLGVDEQDSYAHLSRLITLIKQTGVQTIILHARKAWLKGLSPKENRTVPPLHYDSVYRLKMDYPELEIIINGGIRNLAAIKTHLKRVDGVMLGREACSNPYLFAPVDHEFYQARHAVRSRQQVILDYMPYLLKQHRQAVPLQRLVRPLIGLFHGTAGAKLWRAQLSYAANTKDLKYIRNQKIPELMD